nr:MAG TPA: Type III restriction/modification enzyme methylation subunit [Caudoviricetes sp.]
MVHLCYPKGFLSSSSYTSYSCKIGVRFASHL